MKKISFKIASIMLAVMMAVCGFSTTAKAEESAGDPDGYVQVQVTMVIQNSKGEVVGIKYFNSDVLPYRNDDDSSWESFAKAQETFWEAMEYADDNYTILEISDWDFVEEGNMEIDKITITVQLLNDDDDSSAPADDSSDDSSSEDSNTEESKPSAPEDSKPSEESKPSTEDSTAPEDGKTETVTPQPETTVPKSDSTGSTNTMMIIAVILVIGCGAALLASRKRENA